MTRVLRAALLQATWTGDKESMIEKHCDYVEQAAQQGAQVICFQELFYSPYFCQVQDSQYYGLAERIPDGPTVKRFQDVARHNNIVVVLPMYEEEQTGVYYNTAVVIDADGAYRGKYRKTHIPQVNNFWEKFYFRPGNLGYPVFETAAGKIGVYICYDRHFPEGARMLGLHGAELVFVPAAAGRGLSMHLWDIEQRAHAIANGYFVGAVNRVGQEPDFGPNDYYGSAYFCDPRGALVGDKASDQQEELIIRELDMDLIGEVRKTWQFYRDRRPEMYSDLTAF